MIRKSVYLALALATLTATSSQLRAEVPPELYREWNDLNTKCFEGDDANPETGRACKKRREVLDEIREYRAYDGNKPKRS
jgi:hypothetical protein